MSHSTIDQIVKVTKLFLADLDFEEISRVIFFDVTKASDTVWHKELVSKLLQSGMSHNHFLN